MQQVIQQYYTEHEFAIKETSGASDERPLCMVDDGSGILSHVISEPSEVIDEGSFDRSDACSLDKAEGSFSSEHSVSEYLISDHDQSSLQRAKIN